MKVFTQDEYSTLKSVIIGSVENFQWPKNDIEFDRAIAGSSYHNTLDSHTLPDWVLTEAEEDLDALESVMHEQGVKTFRPSIVGPHWAYSARDILLTLGDKVIQTPTPFSSRANELDLYPFLQNADCNIIKAPRPKSVNDPVFDAANVLKCGDKLLYSLSHSANEAGAEWLQTQVGTDYEVIKWRVVDHTITHIDSTILSLDKNTILINASRVKQHQLPAFLKDFRKIWVEDVKVRDFHHFPFAGKWIGMNVLSLNPETIIVDDIQTDLAENLRNNGFEVITTPMRQSRTLGGGFHCVTCDLERG